jgi:hypothetical protein
MKNLLFGFIATVMFGFAGNAQDLKTRLEKSYGTLTSVNVPVEVLTTQKSLFEQSIPVYVKGGSAILVFNEFGLKGIYVTSGVMLSKDFQSRLIQSKAIFNGTQNSSKSWLSWIKDIVDILCGIIGCE